MTIKIATMIGVTYNTNNKKLIKHDHNAFMHNRAPSYKKLISIATHLSISINRKYVHKR